MTTYTKIRFRPEGERLHTVYLVDAIDTEVADRPAIAGHEVGLDGSPRDRAHLIARALIVSETPCRMNLKYAQLDPIEWPLTEEVSS
ncbi:MAG TPA: hypothetical protein VFH61_10505 [Thermoleophilia bacterium]|nr:hypothetical protein [Thermoleophilia bacterium]